MPLGALGSHGDARLDGPGSMSWRVGTGTSRLPSCIRGRKLRRSREGHVSVYLDSQLAGGWGSLVQYTVSISVHSIDKPRRNDKQPPPRTAVLVTSPSVKSMQIPAAQHHMGRSRAAQQLRRGPSVKRPLDPDPAPRGLATNGRRPPRHSIPMATAAANQNSGPGMFPRAPAPQGKLMHHATTSSRNGATHRQ